MAARLAGRMPVSKDGPPSGRIVFGYRQSKDAGVPYSSPKTVGETNLEHFLLRRPGLRARVSTMRQQGIRPNRILNDLREEGLDGQYCVSRWRDPEHTKHAGSKYSDDRRKLEDEAERDFTLGLLKFAVLWWHDNRAGKWIEIRAWPEETS